MSAGGKSSKMTKKSFRKRYASKKKSQAKKNLDTQYLKVKTTCLLAPTQGVTVSNYISWFPQLIDPTNSSAIAVQKNPTFNLYCYMYDKVRVNKMMIRVKPKANVLAQDNAQNDQDLTLVGDGRVHTVLDRNALPPASIPALSHYSSYKSYNVLKPFTKSYKVKYPTGVWIDTAKGTIDLSEQQVLKKLGCFGGIYLYAENFVEDVGELFNEPWAQVEIEYDCVFMGRTMNNLSLNEDGSLTIKEFVNAYAPQSVVIPTGGVFNPGRLDASGNIINYDPDENVNPPPV